MILLQSYYYLLYFKREFCFYHGNVECCGLYFVCFVVLVFCFWVNKINLSVQRYGLFVPPTKEKSSQKSSQIYSRTINPHFIERHYFAI